MGNRKLTPPERTAAEAEANVRDAMRRWQSTTVLAAHLSAPPAPAVPPIIPAAIRLARAREDALRVAMRVESTPIWDEVVEHEGWNPRTLP